jgi:hypothetical protein
MNHTYLIKNILEKHNVKYWTEGKNVSPDTINVQCPFKSCGDHSNHMGIFKSNLLFHCWKCNKKGHLSFLLAVLTGQPVERCEQEIRSEKITLGLGEEEQEFEEQDSPKKKQVSPLPDFFEPLNYQINNSLLNSYTKRRKLTIDTLIERKCGICKAGPYMHRLIFPITFNNQQVSFVAADMTGQAKTKYLFPNSEKYLYGYDEIPDEPDILVVTEGVLDILRVGIKFGVAQLGSYMTDVQKLHILRKKPKNLVFALDGDAYWHAKESAKFFDPIIENVVTIRMPFEEDPDSLGTEAIWNLIGEHLLLDIEE